MGANDFIRKPIEFDKLLEKMQPFYGSDKIFDSQLPQHSFQPD